MSTKSKSAKSGDSSDTLSFMSNKFREESSFRHEELELRKAELQLNTQKFNLEKMEREASLQQMERQNKILMDLLSQKLNQ